MSTLQRAKRIAQILHEGQTDKAGRPYLEHLIAVASALPTEELKIIAFLHDAVEDHPERCSFDALRKEGFAEEIITALESLTKRAGEDFGDYLGRVAQNDRAIAVKLADLTHNSQRERIPHPTPKDEIRFEKYRQATEYLNNLKKTIL